MGRASGLSSGHKLKWEVDTFSPSLCSEQTILLMNQKLMVFLRLGEHVEANLAEIYGCYMEQF